VPNINKIQEWVKKLAHCKEDIVFVGSVSEGKINPNDIDIAVTSTEGLHQFGKIEYWKTNSCLAYNAQRCKIKAEVKIDIWIYSKLPEYHEVDNIKYQTKKATISHYKEALSLAKNDTIKNIIENKLKVWINMV
tara:strand:- start:48 stop:449 length:402 start_codon:yes stop_codon:yes gene_type:complete